LIFHLFVYIPLTSAVREHKLWHCSSFATRVTCVRDGRLDGSHPVLSHRIPTYPSVGSSSNWN